MGGRIKNESIGESAKLADHFEALSVSPVSTPEKKIISSIRKSARVASRSSSMYSTPSRPSSSNKRMKIAKRFPIDSGLNVCKQEARRKRTRKALFQSSKRLLSLDEGACACLPGREEEYNILCETLLDSLVTGQGCCICNLLTILFPYWLVISLDVSGVPGTGKTATTKRVLASLAKKGAPEFDFIEVNGMRLTDASQVYTILWENISGKSVSGGVALKRLSKYFEDPDRPTVLLLDELDIILRNKGGILYHFFEWTGWNKSQLIVIAIANTMDLPERFLPNRIASRMGGNRLNFKPYTYPQLMAIITYHLSSQHRAMFHPDAIEFCARKISAVSGDARRAVALAKSAVTWVEQSQLKGQQGPNLITIAVIAKAIDATAAGNPVQCIVDCSFYQKLLLLAILLATRSLDIINITIEQASEHFWQLLRANGKGDSISFSKIRLMACELELLGLIVLAAPFRTHPKAVAATQVSLQVPEEEMIFALRKVPEFQRHLNT